MTTLKNQKRFSVLSLVFLACIEGYSVQAGQPETADPGFSEIQLVEGSVDGLAIEKAVNTCLYFGDRKKGSPSLVQEIISQMNGQALPVNFRKQIKPRTSELSMVASADFHEKAVDAPNSEGKHLHLSQRGLASMGLADLGDVNAKTTGAGPKILGIQAVLHPSRTGAQEMGIEYYPSEDARGDDKPVRIMARLPYPFAQEVRVDRKSDSDSSLDSRGSKVSNLTLRIPRGSGDFFLVDNQGIRLMKSISVDTASYVNCLREQF